MIRWAKPRDNYRRIASEKLSLAIRIASVRWRSYISSKPQKLVLKDCAAIRIARLAFIRLTSDTGIGQNVPNARGGGGELAPEVVLAKFGLLTPEFLRIFYRNSIEKGQNSGAPKIKIFTPPLIFGGFDPPYPGLQ